MSGRTAVPVAIRAVLLALALWAGAGMPARAATVSTAPHDGTAFDDKADGSFETIDTTDRSYVLSRNLSPFRTERALMEFSVPSVPGQTLSMVTWTGYINLSQGLAGQPVPVEIVAYPGDGILDIEDATRDGVKVASFNVVGNGAFEVPIDVSVAGGLFDAAASRIVGLRFEIPGGSNGGPGIGIASTEGAAFFPYAQLNFTFVPEPSTATLATAVLAVMALGRRSRP